MLLGIFVEYFHHDEQHTDVYANHVGYPNGRGELYIIFNNNIILRIVYT